MAFFDDGVVGPGAELGVGVSHGTSLGDVSVRRGNGVEEERRLKWKKGNGEEGMRRGMYVFVFYCYECSVCVCQSAEGEDCAGEGG